MLGCPVVYSVNVRKPSNHQFCVQEYSADIEFSELTQQAHKLDIL